MKKIFTYLLVFLSCNAYAYNNAWKLQSGAIASRGDQQLHPDKTLVYYIDNADLRAVFAHVPGQPASGTVIELPAPDGSFRSFRVWESSNMEAPLAAKYPEIKSYTAYALDNNSVTAKLDFSPYGFDAMVYDGSNTYFIDPYSRVNDGFYLCYYKKDYKLPVGKTMHCSVGEEKTKELGMEAMDMVRNKLPISQLKIHGATKHIYRLAIGCTGEYAVAVAGANPQKTAVLTAINKTLNRINGVYETEMSIHMDLVAKEDTMIFLDGTTDPYDNLSDIALMGQNQTTADARIGASNYDVGHVFSSNDGGRSDVGVICVSNAKARGTTGQPNPTGDAFDIDYVAHEMGHQFGAYHTFNADNANANFCRNNGVSTSAYEPGSGSSLMAYAGICDAANNLQGHSDDYFHAKSLDEINDYTTLNTGAQCGTTSSSGNTPNTIPAFNNTYFIPFLTCFELDAPQAADVDGDQVNYCWEQWDLGDFGSSFPQVKLGPIFRSFEGTTAQRRVFPKLDKIRDNILWYTGEKLPEIARAMNFTLTTRDVHNGWGSYNTPGDMITLQVINTTTPFLLTSPNTATDYWQIGSSVTVTWDVSNTTAPPINAANVDIYLSLDDGQTYPYTLATSVPNTGSAVVTVPAGTYTASARVKVKGNGNVFFDISNVGFIINDWPASVPEYICDALAQFYPNPAKDILNIRLSTDKEFNMVVSNTLGQKIWQQDVSTQATVNVSGWAKGVYNLKLTSKEDGKCFVKRVVVD